MLAEHRLGFLFSLVCLFFLDKRHNGMWQPLRTGRRYGGVSSRYNNFVELVGPWHHDIMVKWSPREGIV